jgi:large subunit ribosomal protein L4
MPKAKQYDMTGQLLGEIDLPEAAFGITPHPQVVWEAVRCYLANQRRGTHDTKTRHEVSGGGRKPWKQKGTGRARQGSTRAVQWVGGGRAHGPKPRSYSYRLPRRVRKLAMSSALSQRASEGNVAVIQNLALEAPRTGAMAAFMKAAGLADRRVCLITREADRNVWLSCRNLPRMQVLPGNAINVYELVKADVLVITADALPGIEEACQA